MNQILAIFRSRQRSPLSYFFIVCLISFQLVDTASAQSPMPLKHAGTAAGAPAGSYALSGFENVNLFNGKLDFHLPMVQVGGRGDVGYTVNLNIEASWHINRVTQPDTHFDNPEDYDWGMNSGYGPGIMFGQAYTSYYPLPCDPANWNLSETVTTLTRLTFKTQEGTAYEFVDQASYGSLQDVYTYCGHNLPGQGYNRGKIFVTTDGSGMTFISDVNIFDFNLNTASPFSVSGVLFMSNGTRYRIDNGAVQWIQDRNGNRIEFSYGDGISQPHGLYQVKDSIGRKVSFCYANHQQVGNCGNFPDYDSITYSGFGGAPRTIKIWKGPTMTISQPPIIPRVRSNTITIN
jgi:hypothetical protein